ncbi:MAG: hypothetical protein RIQ81_693 [Pseudomonadota bacterium]
MLLERQVARISAQPFARYKFTPVIGTVDGIVEAKNIDFRQAMEWTMRLTVAHDVEWLAWEGKCGNWGQLAKAATDLRALGFLAPEKIGEGHGALPAQVTVSANSSFIVSSARIRDRFVEALGLALTPDAALRLRLDLYRNRLRVLVSLAGEPLYKRGYKKHLGGAVAPLPEHQAAACIEALRGMIIESSGRTGFDALFVPFAGTGTFAFEWVISILGTGPGGFKRSFAFEDFSGIPAATIDHLRGRMAPELSGNGAMVDGKIPSVVCLECHADALTELRGNAASFVEITQIPADAISVFEGDFFKADASVSLRPFVREGGHFAILLNPPYGQRLKLASEARKYFARVAGRIADLEIQLGVSFSGCCIVPDEQASAAFVKALNKTHKTRTVHFTHGGADTRLVIFIPAGLG